MISIINKINKIEQKIGDLQGRIEDCKVENHTPPTKTAYSPDIIKSLQSTTTSYTEKELFDLRIATRQLIQQVVKRITVHAYNEPMKQAVIDKLKMSFTEKEVNEYLKEVENMPPTNQYTVELHNGLKQHIAFQLETPYTYFVNHKWKVDETGKVKEIQSLTIPLVRKNS